MPAPYDLFSPELDENTDPYLTPFAPVMGGGEPMFTRQLLVLKVYFRNMVLAGGVLAVSGLLVGGMFLAYSRTGSDFETALYIELSSGLMMFALLPFTLATAGKWPKLTYLCLLLLAGICGVAAYHQTGTEQSLLLEGAVGLLIILIFDIGYASLMSKVAAAAVKASEEYREFREEWDGWD